MRPTSTTGREALTLHVANVAERARTLGPGVRAVVWVWGCTRGCAGCVAGPILGKPSRPPVSVDSLAQRILAIPGMDGVTFSGGEPFEQAEALVALCDRLRTHREVSLMSYSGFTRAEIAASSDPHRRSLLSRLDILVDGPYLRGRHADLLWRGSSNQRLHLLTPRHAELEPLLDSAPSAGVEVVVDAAGRVSWIGVPEIGFAERLDEGLRRRGIRLHPEEGVWT